VNLLLNDSAAKIGSNDDNYAKLTGSEYKKRTWPTSPKTPMQRSARISLQVTTKIKC